MATVILDVVKGVNKSIMIGTAQSSGTNKKTATIGFQATGTWTGNIKLKRSINGIDYATVKDADGNDVVFDSANPFIDLLPTDSYIQVDLTGVSSTDLKVEVSI